MFLYLRLLLAHFIGDFPLQTNRIYQWKLKSFCGVFPHSVIIFLCGIVMWFPYLDRLDVWMFLIFIFVVHHIQDWSKVTFTRKTNLRFFYYTLDQIYHVIAISFIWFTDLHYLAPSTFGLPDFIADLYMNDHLMIVLMALIITSYNGHHMIHLLEVDILGPTKVVAPWEQMYGMIERICITTIVILDWRFIMIAPLIVMGRILFERMEYSKVEISAHFSSAFEMICSASIAGVTGLITYWILWP